MMTAAAWYAQHPPGYVAGLAVAERSDDAAKPWVVLAFSRRGASRCIVAGYNRWTGQEINWIVPSFDDARYDLGNAAEVMP